MKQIIKNLEAYVRENHIGREYALDKFLDFLIEFFDVSHILNFEKHVNETAKENPALMSATLEWMVLVSKEIEKGGWYDSLGNLYEQMYQSKNKASALGQFFTPQPLCDLMAKITVKDLDGESTFNDSACGSGRTLLAAFSDKRNGYFIGEDIDHMSVKMCALNLMIHGARGRVVCHDALCSPIHFLWGYEINEVRYPFPSPFYSLRRISNPKPEGEDEPRIVPTELKKARSELKIARKGAEIVRNEPKIARKGAEIVRNEQKKADEPKITCNNLEKPKEEKKYKPGEQLSLF